MISKVGRSSSVNYLLVLLAHVRMHSQKRTENGLFAPARRQRGSGLKDIWSCGSCRLILNDFSTTEEDSSICRSLTSERRRLDVLGHSGLKDLVILVVTRAVFVLNPKMMSKLFETSYCECKLSVVSRAEISVQRLLRVMMMMMMQLNYIQGGFKNILGLLGIVFDSKMYPNRMNWVYDVRF